MRVTGKTPDRVKKVYIQGSQGFSTFHFDDSQGPPKDGIWFHVKGSSATSDTAGSSVVHETAVSFSPPPKRVPPRPSDHPRKRKDSVADFGDDDDFVGVPPRHPTADSSKATRVDVRKIKKSKSSLAGPKHSEGDQNPSKRTNPNYRSAPNKVVEAIKSLTEPQKVKIRDYPFGPLLDLKLKGLESTKLLVFLMDSLDPDTLTLDIGIAKLLVPGTSDFITGKEAALTEDMATLSLVNWASVIFDDIAIAAKLWRLKKKACTNPSMHGCLMFLLVYYLDNLLGEHSTNPVLTPRIAHITKQQLLDLIEEDKQAVNGLETFGALPLRSQDGTCYMEGTHSPTYDPPSTQSADIPTTSHSSPAFFPSMHHHLASCFNRFPAEQQHAAKEALWRYDEEVGILTLQISTAKMTAIQEIKRILCDGQSHTNPTPPICGTGTTNPLTTQSPLRATHTAPNMEADLQRQPISSHVADDPNVLLHEGRNTVADTNVTDATSYTHVTESDGFNKLSSSQQDISQCPYNSPLESPYDSPHEVLTNGVCKTCHEEDEMCLLDEELFTEEVDEDASVVDEATFEKRNEPSGLRPQLDNDAPRQMASPMTPHVFRPMRNTALGPSFQGLHTESSPMHPPVFDKTPNLSHSSRTPFVDDTEHVTQWWEVSQQL